MRSLLALAAVLSIAAAATDPFELWIDYPGSDAWKQRNPGPYDLILTRANTSFDTTGGVTVRVRSDD